MIVGITRGYSNHIICKYPHAHIICTKVNVQQVDVGRIIGQSGRKIQALQEGSGASVKIEMKDEKNVVVITGFRENVEKIKPLSSLLQGIQDC